MSALALAACDEGAALPLEGADATPEPTSPEEVTITTLDGLTLSGTWQEAPGADRGPGVLLLHQYGPDEHDRHDWDPAWDALLAAGVSVLAIDFRGHGLSDPSPVPPLELLSDRDQLPEDVRAGLLFLRDRNFAVDDAQIGVAGLSVGGNLAAVASNFSDGSPSDWGATRIFTVSALEDRARDLAGDDSLTLRDGAYAAAELEEEQSADTQALYDRTAGDRERIILGGTAAHGADLLSESSALRASVARWFSPGS